MKRQTKRKNIYLDAYLNSPARETSETSRRDTCEGWLSEIDWRPEQLQEISIDLAHRIEELQEELRAEEKRGRVLRVLYTVTVLMCGWALAIAAVYLVMVLAALAWIMDWVTLQNGLEALAKLAVDATGGHANLIILVVALPIAWVLGKRIAKNENTAAFDEIRKDIDWLASAQMALQKRLNAGLITISCCYPPLTLQITN